MLLMLCAPDLHALLQRWSARLHRCTSNPGTPPCNCSSNSSSNSSCSFCTARSCSRQSLPTYSCSSTSSRQVPPCRRSSLLHFSTIPLPAMHHTSRPFVPACRPPRASTSSSSASDLQMNLTHILLGLSQGVCWIAGALGLSFFTKCWGEEGMWTMLLFSSFHCEHHLLSLFTCHLPDLELQLLLCYALCQIQPLSEV